MARMRLLTGLAIAVLVTLTVAGTAVAATPEVVDRTQRRADSFALTFDDGPDPTYTPQVLEQLDRHRIKATFCVMGRNAIAYPELVRAIAARGHRLCNHTMTHPNLATLTPEETEREILGASDAIRAAVPRARIDYFRAPYGSWTDNARNLAASKGMQPLGWSVDTLDWNQPTSTADRIVEVVRTRFAENGVILMHDAGGNRSQTVAALPRIADFLQCERGYKAAFPAVLH
jgi:peptidoglycan-N-acetylglucosamine deacetylase